MRLPDPVRDGVETALRSRTGRSETIRDVSPVGGGCISPVGRVTMESGDVYFLKHGTPDLPGGLLSAEARGLRALGEAGAVRVPEVVASSDDPGQASSPEWLLLEWLEPGASQTEFAFEFEFEGSGLRPSQGGHRMSSWAALGVQLAALHRHRADAFGAAQDNFIGSLAQGNGWVESWPAFWRDRRLEPQLRMAVDGGYFEAGVRDRFGRLFGEMDDRVGVGDEEGASLLHGDLWSGNVHMMSDGSPAIIDPSVYHGHREVDLAMADLFGGFGAGFRAAYEEAWPLEPGYEPVRRSVYQLYYLLVHVNLFGSGYVGRTVSALDRALG